MSFCACYICYQLGYFQGNDCDCEDEKKDSIWGKYFRNIYNGEVYRVFKVDQDTIYLESVLYYKPLQCPREIFDKEWSRIV